MSHTLPYLPGQNGVQAICDAFALQFGLGVLTFVLGMGICPFAWNGSLSNQCFRLAPAIRLLLAKFMIWIRSMEMISSSLSDELHELHMTPSPLILELASMFLENTNCQATSAGAE